MLLLYVDDGRLAIFVKMWYKYSLQVNKSVEGDEVIA